MVFALARMDYSDDVALCACSVALLAFGTHLDAMRRDASRPHSCVISQDVRPLRMRHKDHRAMRWRAQPGAFALLATALMRMNALANAL